MLSATTCNFPLETFTTMLLSIFTPSHNFSHLRELYLSLASQTYSNWEWVICPNGEAAKMTSPGLVVIPEAMDDPRVRWVPAPEGLKNVGALKKFACAQCSGDVFIEVDHDDYLLPTALESIFQTFANQQADFMYSDCVNFRPDGSTNYWDEALGFINDTIEIGGVKYTYSKSFEPDARSLLEIYQAPNHVRAWGRSIYQKIGGHDEDMELGDDHDLICRTYLAGGKFVYVPEVLYMYREGSQNTYAKNLDKIFNIQKATGERYCFDLVKEWARRHSYPLIDMGGAMAQVRTPGFQVLDARNLPGVDIVHDAREPLPFADNSIGAFRCQDFLEHIPIGSVVPLMNEMYRCLVPGGWLLTATPSTDGRGAFQDPTHVSFWNANSFWYYTKSTQRDMVPEIKARFQAARIFDYFPTPEHQFHRIQYIVADLVALKGQRCPGRKEC